jgi:thiamine pyrophosphate-dependent acetolactate synthase large subunit-like protein
MDFETAVRERIPILSIVLNNSSMAIELPEISVATEKYRSTDISGQYAELACALGGYGERVSEPKQIIPALRRTIGQTQEGTRSLDGRIGEKAGNQEQRAHQTAGRARRSRHVPQGKGCDLSNALHLLPGEQVGHRDPQEANRPVPPV